ncbi:phosphate propanoyltransferase [Aquibacillus halophilus]|uniref:Phosphate propanoyltransferase n=2 Tax=Aquibacillus halophilus TaxID=930132 RepID=A0A6A8D6C4_9BACI|nr:phosphate propanoyltransferase [Aquibacillus halophilus]MRH41128.1 phosphate propanoyltransferase [Aquibacillus halophilus]
MGIVTESKLRVMLAKGIPNPYSIAKNTILTPAAKDFLKDRGISYEVVADVKKEEEQIRQGGYPPIPVGVSNRHVHLSQEDINILFGKGYVLTSMKELSQKGQFAAVEQVNLIGSKGTIKRVRILGPSRDVTQVEVSKTDSFHLGLRPMVKLSGDLNDTPGIVIEGPKGTITLTQGVIIAKCHVHMSFDDAKIYQVTDGDRISLKSSQDRSVTFNEVIIRVNSNFSLDFHIDMDEANAGFITTGDYVTMVSKDNNLFSGT